jgi:hypothetical protein
VSLPDSGAGVFGLCVRLDDTGNATLNFLDRERTQRFANKTGFRSYDQYRLPLEFEEAEVTVRLHRNDEDAKQKLNRVNTCVRFPAPIRPSPAYTRRGDAESVNRDFEDTLYLNRAHSEVACARRPTCSASH